MRNKYQPSKMILTAGPSITKLEHKYIIDAAVNGWNEKAYYYLRRFEKEFAIYIGSKEGLVTSGGTGALWLALAAAGIGPGDEVILPEITYFACSDVISLLGAKPVFVDILSDTWCIDPRKIDEAITKKTKAIMPVHLYGNLAEMDEIMTIAKQHNLFVVEDACPAAGSVYKGRRPGSIGHAGAYSFQGAKIMVTGFGGMVLTNDEKLMTKIKQLNNHGELPGRKFWQTEVGYSFELPNISCAMGLAQLHRLESFVSKKRKIFDWYFELLGGIEGISMNYERPNTLSNKWMTSIILNRDFGITRNQLMSKLRDQLIDTRPFFYPISMFPMYSEQKTPVAHHIGLNGINLPSGYARTKNEVEYICHTIKQILKVK